MRVVSSRYVGIGTFAPSAKLEVSGTVSATILKLADSPPDACNATNYGAVNVINGAHYTCRQ